LKSSLGTCGCNPKFALNFQIYWDEQEEHTGRRLRSSMHELAGLDSGKQYNCSRESIRLYSTDVEQNPLMPEYNLAA
jgi:hypothetical protein